MSPIICHMSYVTYVMSYIYDNYLTPIDTFCWHLPDTSCHFLTAADTFLTPPNKSFTQADTFQTTTDTFLKPANTFLNKPAAQAAGADPSRSDEHEYSNIRIFK